MCSHKEISTICISPMLDEGRVIKKNKSKSSKLFLSHFLIRDMIYYNRCFLWFVCNKRTSFIIRMSIFRVWTFNQHSYMYTKKWIRAHNFVHWTANNRFHDLVSFFDVIFEWVTPVATKCTLLLDHPFDWIRHLVD